MESYRALLEQYRALKEQNEKLQGSIRSQNTIIEQLVEEESKIVKERDEYKKAFDDIFTKNCAQQWEKYKKEQKEVGRDPESFTIGERITFFNKVINDTKIFILKKVAEKRSITESNIELQEHQFNQKKENLKKILDDLFKAIGYKNPPDVLDIIDDQKEFKQLRNNIRAGIVENEVQEQQKEKEKQQSKQFSTGGFDINSFTNADVSPKKAKKDQKKAPEQKEVKQTPTVDVINEILPDFLRSNNCDYEMAKQLMKTIFNQNLNQDDRIVLTVIGSTGEYTISSIAKIIAAQKGISDQQAYQTVRTAKDNLAKNRLLADQKELSTGTGRPTQTFGLTDRGYLLFHTMFEQDPKRCKLVVGASEQKSPEHYQLIMKTIEILQGAGYECVQEDEKDVNGVNSSICDIVATKNFNEYRVECEIGEGAADHYNEKFAKILAVCPHLIFVTKNKESKEKLKNIMDNYIQMCGGNGQFGKRYQKILVSIAELQEKPDLIATEIERQKNKNKKS